jgi:hypothetical protein
MIKARAFLLFVFGTMCFASTQAQEPYTWSFTARKLSNQKYEIHCVVNVNSPWQINMSLPEFEGRYQS